MRENRQSGSEGGAIQTNVSFLPLSISGLFTKSSNNGIEQILPIRITAFNQFQFPFSLPFFQSHLSLNSGFHTLMYFIPNQLMNTVAFGKTFHHVVFVLPYPLDEV